MSIESQIRRIAKEELKRQLDEIEKRFMDHLEKELDEVKKQLAEVCERTDALEGELSDRWNVLVKLRKYTLDQMVSEYKRIAEIIRPGKEETEETVEPPETPENAET
jgi:flagellar motility protein MotE (MotC chaperone)